LKYVSTRGRAPVLAFDDVLLTGLANDGGLYVPETWPDLTEPLAAAADRSYAETATAVMAPFVGDTIASADLAALVADAYAGFDHPDVAPLHDLGDGRWLMELFHGPTLAFKDMALQVVGRLFEHVLGRRGERVTIVVATSGDTGSAAIEACRDRDAITIVVLHPAGRVSDVQRRQMTTVDSPNVANVAIDGTFDDCQDLVKALFADEPFRSDAHLSAMNSINWARVMAQVVYYVVAAAKVGGGRPVDVAVPTGNFGNVFAGEVARRCGVPIRHLGVATNRNDILARFFATGVLQVDAVVPTISPAMDIQVSSNLERLLFDLLDRDGDATAELLAEFRRTGRAEMPPAVMARLGDGWWAGTADEGLTRATIAGMHERAGITVDPHTAVGLAVSEARVDPGVPMVCLATAHPAKFPDAVEEATGERPVLPPHLADLLDRPERYDTLANDLDAVRAYVAGAFGERADA
jgi:threonine synthase